MTEFDTKIGFSYLRAMHLNDSKKGECLTHISNTKHNVHAHTVCLLILQTTKNMHKYARLIHHTSTLTYFFRIEFAGGQAS